MRAIRMKASIPPDRVLHMALPGDVGEGEAEVIVLLNDERPASPPPPLAEVLRGSPLPPGDGLAKAEIDQLLKRERLAWGNR